MRKTVREILIDLVEILKANSGTHRTLSIDYYGDVVYQIEKCAKTTKEWESKILCKKIDILDKEVDIDLVKLTIIAVSLRLVVSSTNSLDVGRVACSIVEMITDGAK